MMSFRNLLVLVACCYLLVQSTQAARVLHTETTLTNYTLTKRETLKNILVKNGFALEEWYDKTLKLNNLDKESRLQVGQTILIPRNSFYFSNPQAAVTDKELADFIDDELKITQASTMRSEIEASGENSFFRGNFNHRVHFGLFGFENSMENGASSIAPYNVALHYQVIKNNMLNSTDQDWQNFGLAVRLGILSDANVSRSASDESIDNSLKIQAFATYQLRNIINIKPFAEITREDNIMSYNRNDYQARTDRTLWVGMGVNKDFFIEDKLLNVEIELAHTLLSKDLSGYTPKTLNGYRFAIKPEMSIDENNFVTGVIEKSFFSSNDLKNTTLGIGIGRFLN